VRLAWRQAAWLTGVLVFGCAPSKVYISKTFLRPQRIAVLPMSNDTNDLDGPLFIRQLLIENLVRRGYVLVPPAEIDAKLKAQGFTDGGQLKATTPQKIGEWIGVDGLLYSTLEEFNYINVGYYAQRVVKVQGQLVSAQTGEKLWEAERGFSTRTVAVDKKQADRAFAVQMATKAVEKMTHVPLQFESRQAVYQLLNTLP
jgi:hypothetical protein